MRRNIDTDIAILGVESGALYLEAALYLPVLLVVFLALAQLAHIAFAWELTHYASFAAARSVLIANPAYSVPGSIMNEEQAAALSAAVKICPFRSDDTSVRKDSEGRYWKGCAGVRIDSRQEAPNVRFVTVFMDVPLLFHLKFFSGNSDSSGADSSHYRVSATSLISKRVCPRTNDNLPAGGLVK